MLIELTREDGVKMLINVDNMLAVLPPRAGAIEKNPAIQSEILFVGGLMIAVQESIIRIKELYAS